MSKADVEVVGEPSQLTSGLDTALGKQPQVTDLEEVTNGDDENPEFKLPKMSSLVVVLMTNVLLEVIPLSLSRLTLVLSSFRIPGVLFHHRSIIQRVCGTVGR